MNDEYLWWFAILVVVGVAVVVYLALGPVPEIPADDGQGAPGEPSPSTPVSTTEPGPAAPASTSETP